jgi:predicted HAD superfamily hydrolase
MYCLYDQKDSGVCDIFIISDMYMPTKVKIRENPLDRTGLKAPGMMAFTVAANVTGKHTIHLYNHWSDYEYIA